MPTSTASIPSITEALQPLLDRNEVAGFSFLVAQEGRVRQTGILGLADLKTKRPIEPDTLFWVASMTKPIVAASVLNQVTEGKLNLDEPVSAYLPEFKEMWMITEKGENRQVLERSPSPNLRQMLAHTAGLADVPTPFPGTPLAEWAVSISRAPLQFHPGSAWAYNNSGMNVLGRVVEVVSGQPFPLFLRERFFEPLGMYDTTFILNREQKKRLAVPYKFIAEERKLIPVPIFLLRAPSTSPKQTICPGGGLFSTTADMFAFYQMLLDGGTARGQRFFSADLHREMITRQTGELKTGFTEGMCFGLGVGMVREPIGLTGMLSPGTFGHGGVYGTQAWCDPVRRSVSLMMCQRSNFPPNPDASDFRYTFNRAVADLLSSPE